MLYILVCDNPCFLTNGLLFLRRQPQLLFFPRKTSVKGNATTLPHLHLKNQVVLPLILSSLLYKAVKQLNCSSVTSHSFRFLPYIINRPFFKGVVQTPCLFMPLAFVLH